MNIIRKPLFAAEADIASDAMTQNESALGDKPVPVKSPESVMRKDDPDCSKSGFIRAAADAQLEAGCVKYTEILSCSARSF